MHRGVKSKHDGLAFYFSALLLEILPSMSGFAQSSRWSDLKSIFLLPFNNDCCILATVCVRVCVCVFSSVCLFLATGLG